jgi:hypothetical protein
MRDLLFLCLSLFVVATGVSQEQCGTMQNLNERMVQDSTLKGRIEKIEEENQTWIEEHGKIKHRISVDNKDSKQNSKSLCSNFNTYFTTVTAPANLSSVVSPNPNCVYGGEYVTVTNLIAGNIYEISTCGVDNFDTQITIYKSNTNTAVAHNDDWCGAQSVVFFNPITSGSYDILVNEFDCQSNQLCASLEVKLIYTPRTVVTIPVIVHVIHNGEAIGNGVNISTAQINSQINVLNQDFRRLNADINSTPAAIRGLSDDALIEFCFAQQDEFGNATTGIERIDGGQVNWTKQEIESVLKPQTVWDSDKYLNIWIVDFGGVNESLLGYAQFPGDEPITDGVVIKYDCFGSVGNLNPSYNKGRTTTHEIGHWLNLRHIWGDSGGCQEDDLVDDTPQQDVPTYGTPTFPMLDNCSPNYPGNMFQNYMDYSNDIVLTAFTAGQTSRMDAVLFNQRSGLLISNGCEPPSSSIEGKQDIRISVVPNPSNGIFDLFYSINNEFEVNVIDIAGKEVFSKQIIPFENNKIDISHCKTGVYYIIMSNKDETFHKKIVLIF